MSNEIVIDLHDLEAMIKVMDEYHTTDTMLFGETEDGEMTTTSIFKDKIVLVVYQENHWVRKEILHRDGQIDVMFDGKWE